MKVVVKDLAQKKFEVDIEPTDTVSHLFPPLFFPYSSSSSQVSIGLVVVVEELGVVVWAQSPNLSISFYIQ